MIADFGLRVADCVIVIASGMKPATKLKIADGSEMR
jgi:hypothetical protein